MVELKYIPELFLMNQEKALDLIIQQNVDPMCGTVKEANSLLGMIGKGMENNIVNVTLLWIVT